MRKVVVAPDKCKGSASATEMATAIAERARSLGWQAPALPMSDGGEGLLDALSGLCPELRSARVVGADGTAGDAPWRIGGSTAVVELAAASGLTRVGGPAANDPWTATTWGTGQLIAVAARAVGPKGTVIVGLGGSATTDGGVGLVEAVRQAGGLAGTRLIGACDVTTRFVDAARIFGPQKGADATMVAALEARLEDVADRYGAETGIDVRHRERCGAAGGAGGGIVVLGGTLTSGFDLVSAQVGLDRHLADADAVITAEGSLDGSSFLGKVAGGVIAAATARGVPILVIAGMVDEPGRASAIQAGATVCSLSERFGLQRAWAEPAALAAVVAGEWLEAAH